MYIAFARLVFSRVFYFCGNLKKTDYSNLSIGRITGFVFERIHYCNPNDFVKEALTLKVNVFIVVQNVFSTKTNQTETSSSKFVPYQRKSTNKL